MRKLVFNCLILLCWTANAQSDVIHNHENPVDRKDPLKSQNYVDPKAHLLELIVGVNLPDIPNTSKITKKKIRQLNEERQMAFEKLIATALSNKMDRLVGCEI